MSKITFRADDDLVEELEALETSKSEAMREALRAYLEEGVSETSARDGSDGAENENAARADETAIDDLVRERVDELLTERLAELEYNAHGRERQPRPQSSRPQDVNVTIALEDGRARRVDEAQDPASPRARPHAQARDSRAGRESEHDHDHSQQPHEETQSRTPSRQRTCGQCGEDVDGEHVYCPNCGEKVSRRLFCDCGDELRSDWAFCPSCGRRTASADVLESNSQRS